ncbi:MAG: HdeD family acid-resistance protein [Nitrospirae bacterium]|nr:HdeD family acid-resistance protein [Candidatus Manganitrophaceae bacterium]
MFDLLTRNWWVLILRGVLAILFGVLAFSRPGMTLAALVLFFGAYVFVDGIFAIILALGGWEKRNDRWLLLLQGVIGVGIGILTFRAPGITAIGLLLYIAAWSLAIGVLQIAAAIRLRRSIEGEVWLAISGVASILFAAILMWAPAAGALALLWVIASYAIIFGATLIFLGFKVHGLHGPLRKAEA